MVNEPPQQRTNSHLEAVFKLLVGLEEDVNQQPLSNLWHVKVILTTVIHAVEPGDVNSTEVKPLANDLIEVRYGGGDCGDALILVEGQWPVVHD